MRQRSGAPLSPLSLSLSLLALCVLAGPVGTACGAASPSAPGSTFFSGVDVFDGDRLLPDQDVLVVGSVVSAMGPAGVLVVPEGATRVTCTDCTLLPGLVDAHVHLNMGGTAPWVMWLPPPQETGARCLAAGITSVLVAKSGRAEQVLAEDVEAGRADAPHLYLAGPAITGRDSHPIPLLRSVLPWPLRNLVPLVQPTAATPEEARAGVERLHRRYPTPFFKFMYDDFPKGSAQMDRATLAAGVQAATDAGARPVVHTGAAQDMVDAAEVGAALLMHAAWQDDLTDAQVAHLAALQVPFVPTLRAFSWSVEAGQGRFDPVELAHVDARDRDAYAHPPASFEKKGVAEWSRSFDEAMAHGAGNTRRLVAAGVPWFAGTDTGVSGVFPGTSLHVELARLVDLGLSPTDVLRHATSLPAAFLEPAGTFGHVAPGQRADLLLVRGDPTAHIRAVDDVLGVWLAGRPVPSWADEAGGPSPR